MSRFIISHRRAGKRQGWEHRRAREALSEALHGANRCDANLVGENCPCHDEARHVAVLDADHEEVRRKVRHPDLVVEPPMEHFAGRVRPPEVGEADEEELAAEAGEGDTLEVTVTDGDGRPLPDTDVFVYFGQGEDRRQVARRTDGRGRAEVSFGAGEQVSKIAAVPRHSRWPMLHAGGTESVNFACRELPAAERSVGWWHRRAGFRRHAKTRGRGIRVGVIDTGVGPNANLDHVHDMGAVVDAALDESGGADVRGHGSHVCGIIGARSRSDREYGGLAPGVTLFSIRVFGKTAGAHQGDIALAIWGMAHEKRCHLINLSLGTGGCSEIERDAIQDAVEHGSLCLCAAGNTGGGVEYPAAFDEAVDSPGREGLGPARLAAGLPFAEGKGPLRPRRAVPGELQLLRKGRGRCRRRGGHHFHRPGRRLHAGAIRVLRRHVHGHPLCHRRARRQAFPRPRLQENGGGRGSGGVCSQATGGAVPGHRPGAGLPGPRIRPLSMSAREYIITVQREHRAATPDTWMRAIGEMEGVEVLNEDERFRMVRVRADDAAVERIREEYADWLHIEERSDHETRE